MKFQFQISLAIAISFFTPALHSGSMARQLGTMRIEKTLDPIVTGGSLINATSFVITTGNDLLNKKANLKDALTRLSAQVILPTVLAQLVLASAERYSDRYNNGYVAALTAAIMSGIFIAGFKSRGMKTPKWVNELLQKWN